MSELDPAPPQRIVAGMDPCAVSRRWRVRLDVVERILRMARLFEGETGRPVTIISGYRSPEKQRALRRQGRPAADPARSTHTSCPATGMDVTIGIAPTRVLKATLGRIAFEAGLRWGGGSRADSGGIPSDWNHFDVGPRAG